MALALLSYLLEAGDMKKSMRVLGRTGVGAALLLVSGSSWAKPRAVVCASYAIVIDDKADGRTVAVCYDKHVEGGWCSATTLR